MRRTLYILCLSVLSTAQGMNIVAQYRKLQSDPVKNQAKLQALLDQAKQPGSPHQAWAAAEQINLDTALKAAPSPSGAPGPRAGVPAPKKRPTPKPAKKPARPAKKPVPAKKPAAPTPRTVPPVTPPEPILPGPAVPEIPVEFRDPRPNPESMDLATVKREIEFLVTYIPQVEGSERKAKEGRIAVLRKYVIDQEKKAAEVVVPPVAPAVPEAPPLSQAELEALGGAVFDPIAGMSAQDIITELTKLQAYPDPKAPAIETRIIDLREALPFKAGGAVPGAPIAPPSATGIPIAPPLEEPGAEIPIAPPLEEPGAGIPVPPPLEPGYVPGGMAGPAGGGAPSPRPPAPAPRPIAPAPGEAERKAKAVGELGEQELIQELRRLEDGSNDIRRGLIIRAMTEKQLDEEIARLAPGNASRVLYEREKKRKAAAPGGAGAPGVGGEAAKAPAAASQARYNQLVEWLDDGITEAEKTELLALVEEKLKGATMAEQAALLATKRRAIVVDTISEADAKEAREGWGD